MPRNNSPSDRLDPALSKRIEGEFQSLMVALDAALAEASPTTLEQVRKATDQLMRAAARIRLEVERLGRYRSCRPGEDRG